MDNVKLFFSSLVFCFIVFTQTGNAQMNGVNIDVSTQSEEAAVTVENTGNKIHKLRIKVVGYLVTDFSNELLVQEDVQEALATIIHQDDLFRTIIHQDDLFRQIGIFCQLNNLTPPQTKSVIRFFRFLLKTPELLDAIVYILDQENGDQLLIDLITGDRNILINEPFTLVQGASETFGPIMQDDTYNLLHVKVSKGPKKGKSQFVSF